MATAELDDLVGHLVRTTDLPPATARRVVQEVIAYCNEETEEFVRRRHRELHQDGRINADIFRSIAAELATRPVAAPQLTERQIRRVIYG